jgi:hypothetical protein
MNMIRAATRAHISGYMRPVILGHQKCNHPKKAETMPPTMM